MALRSDLLFQVSQPFCHSGKMAPCPLLQGPFYSSYTKSLFTGFPSSISRHAKSSSPAHPFLSRSSHSDKILDLYRLEKSPHFRGLLLFLVIRSKHVL